MYRTVKSDTRNLLDLKGKVKINIPDVDSRVAETKRYAIWSLCLLLAAPPRNSRNRRGQRTQRAGLIYPQREVRAFAQPVNVPVK